MTETSVQTVDDKKIDDKKIDDKKIDDKSETVSKDMLDGLYEDIKGTIRRDGSDTRYEQRVQSDDIKRTIDKEGSDIRYEQRIQSSYIQNTLTKNDFEFVAFMTIVFAFAIAVVFSLGVAKHTNDELKIVNHNITVVMHEKMMKDIDKLIDMKINNISENILRYNPSFITLTVGVIIGMISLKLLKYII